MSCSRLSEGRWWSEPSRWLPSGRLSSERVSSGWIRGFRPAAAGRGRAEGPQRTGRYRRVVVVEAVPGRVGVVRPGLAVDPGTQLRAEGSGPVAGRGTGRGGRVGSGVAPHAVPGEDRAHRSSTTRRGGASRRRWRGRQSSVLGCSLVRCRRRSRRSSRPPATRCSRRTSPSSRCRAPVPTRRCRANTSPRRSTCWPRPSTTTRSRSCTGGGVSASCCWRGCGNFAWLTTVIRVDLGLKRRQKRPAKAPKATRAAIGATAALSGLKSPELADVVDRFWVAPVPLPRQPSTLDIGSDLLLRQLPTPASALGGAALVDRLRPLYERFGTVRGTMSTDDPV